MSRLKDEVLVFVVLAGLKAEGPAFIRTPGWLRTRAEGGQRPMVHCGENIQPPRRLDSRPLQGKDGLGETSLASSGRFQRKPLGAYLRNKARVSRSLHFLLKAILTNCYS